MLKCSVSWSCRGSDASASLQASTITRCAASCNVYSRNTPPFPGSFSRPAAAHQLPVVHQPELALLPGGGISAGRLQTRSSHVRRAGRLQLRPASARRQSAVRSVSLGSAFRLAAARFWLQLRRRPRSADLRRRLDSRDGHGHVRQRLPWVSGRWQLVARVRVQSSGGGVQSTAGWRTAAATAAAAVFRPCFSVCVGLDCRSRQFRRSRGCAAGISAYHACMQRSMFQF